MRILLTSDTHAKRYTDLPDVLREEIETADAVIHAGDYGAASFFEEFVSKCRLFYGVLGNNDSLDLPNELVVDLDSVRIAVIHSDMAWWGNRVPYLLSRFRDSAPDIIVYGHTHREVKHCLKKPIILNPGSPTKSRGAFPSYAVLETNGKGKGRGFITDIKKI
jgi:putative phosphoesterase